MKTTTLMFALLAMAAFQSGQPRAPEPKVGDKAPDFTLKALNEDKTFKLSDNFGKQPTVLIFGSYT
jgi:peroxiredoxin